MESMNFVDRFRLYAVRVVPRRNAGVIRGSPGQHCVVESKKAAGLVSAAPLNDDAHAGHAAVHSDARPRFGLGPSWMQREHEDMSRLEIDREPLHDGIQARLAGSIGVRS